MQFGTVTHPIPDEVLPQITETQSWCCEECGSGKPQKYFFSYSTSHDVATGELLERRAGAVWKSSCCNAELMLFDEAVGDFIKWEPTNIDDINRALRS